MTELSKSDDHTTFQKEKYLKRKQEEGEEPSQEYLDLFQSIDQRKREQEADPEWQKNNMEWDLRTTDWILEKVRTSDVYAQNLYAAMCNNDFQKRDVMQILKDETWSCSWRYAGGIIADMRQQGDYMNWYCSGISDGGPVHSGGYVSESIVTAEIEADLLELGWNVVDSGETDY